MFNYCQFACYEDIHLHGLDLMLVACTEAMHASICGCVDITFYTLSQLNDIKDKRQMGCAPPPHSHTQCACMATAIIGALANLSMMN